MMGAISARVRSASNWWVEASEGVVQTCNMTSVFVLWVPTAHVPEPVVLPTT